MIHSASPLPSPRSARRARDLRARHWLLLMEAFGVLVGTSLVIGILPFRWVVRLASRGSAKACSCDDPRGVDDIRWAVEAIARRVPWRTVCFQKGLALHLMLRRRGVPAMLHYGAGKDEHGGLAAHVWVSVGGAIVMGGDVVDRFRCLATYPPAA